MKNYRVIFTQTESFYVDVEAEDKQEARDEFNQLLDDDELFREEWGGENPKELEINFQEWYRDNRNEE